MTSVRHIALTPARAKDVPALARLWHAAWHVAHGAHMPPEHLAKRRPNYFEQMMAEDWAYARLCRTRGEVAGFVMAYEGWVDQLFVAPDLRGRGLGRLLLHDAEHRLRAAGVATGRIDVLAANRPARAFYAHHGWQLHGPAPYPPGGDARLRSVVYIKRLNPKGALVTIR